MSATYVRLKLRSPLLIRVIAALLALAARCWLCTTRFRIASLDGRQHPTNPNSEKFFYAFWHESLLAPLAVPTKIRILISQHADGELIAQTCSWLGFGVVRGSTTRGGCEAIRDLVASSQECTHLGITPDGPKGPRRRLQTGMIWVASVTGLPVVLVGAGYTRAWRATSWDKFAVPLPLSTVCGVVSEPIHIPAGLDRPGLEFWRQHVEQRLLEMTHLAEDWAERTRRDGRNAPPPVATQHAGLRKSTSLCA